MVVAKKDSKSLAVNCRNRSVPTDIDWQKTFLPISYSAQLVLIFSTAGSIYIFQTCKVRTAYLCTATPTNILYLDFKSEDSVKHGKGYGSEESML
jgi:hypothetical protein